MRLPAHAPGPGAFQGWRRRAWRMSLSSRPFEKPVCMKPKAPCLHPAYPGQGSRSRAAHAGRLAGGSPARVLGGGKRVDRPEPSGNDFLADAVSRPAAQETRLRGGQAMDITSEIGTPAVLEQTAEECVELAEGDHLAAAAGPRLPERGPAAAGRKPHARPPRRNAGPPSGRKWRMCRSAWAGSTRRATPST